ncbi:MAG: TIGR04282 family arsenosugar biosynthesis glycosyltransferase [Candidatus Dadabacteria bacterium]|nr:TIGR04282 family arsenosugar biosynthesis glycosyltransferase [Candidatus Dadabacteria bacterium]
MTDKVEKNTLIIFLKYPEAGKVKTRLAKEVGAQKAADIYSYMAKKIIGNVLDKDCYRTIIFYDPPEKENEIKTWLENKQCQIIPQAGETLGDKIIDAFAQVFSSGADKAVIIGTDCIDISSKTITKAIKSLKGVDVVLGPAEDGGYYLLGLSSRIPEIFHEIEWSTGRVLNQTLERIKEKKLNYELLKTLKDIDTIDDLSSQLQGFVKTEEGREG